MKKIKKLMRSLSLSENNSSIESDNSQSNLEDIANSPTHFCIGENKNSQTIQARFHPDSFLTHAIDTYDVPPLDVSENKNNYTPLICELKQYSPKITFTITISPKLCELGYARVEAIHFIHEIEAFMPICISFPQIAQIGQKRDYLYIPLTVSLPLTQQRHGLFNDLFTPVLIAIPSQPYQYFRYKLTDAFLWRYQYIRIREYTSLKMDVIGEIPCDLPFEIIGYPIRAVLPNYFVIGNDCNIINKSLNQRKACIETKDWSLFENAYWIKLQASIVRKLPLMQTCIDEFAQEMKAENKDTYARYFSDKGYVIQQYMGHTVLECIGPLVTQSELNELEHIPITFDENNNLFMQQNSTNLFTDFPMELISHILSYCDFEFVRHVLCRVCKEFYTSSSLPSCYNTAIIPSTFLQKMLQNKRGNLSKVMTSLRKCNRVDIYSLVCGDNRLAMSVPKMIQNRPKPKHRNMDSLYGECQINEFRLEFVSNAALHIALFDMFDFDKCLRVLKLTQCGNISEFALDLLPSKLEELSLMNTVIHIQSWHNLAHLRSLIITKSANLHEMESNSSFLRNIAQTLPKQILKSIQIWDGEESNKIVIQELIESHNCSLNVFGIGGRICLFGPFSTIFTDELSKAYLNLEIISVSCLATQEIISLVTEFGAQLRILEMFCPFVMNEEDDIYHWLLEEENIQIFCSSLWKLEILMCQGFPLHMQRYMNTWKWNELKQKFKDKFKEYGNGSEIPLILFDFAIDLNKMQMWRKTDMKQYLIENQHTLELNFGEGL